MSETKNTYLIRLEAENGKAVSATLEQVGKDGAAAFGKISTSAKSTEGVLTGFTTRALGGLRGQLIALAGTAISGAFIKTTLDMARNSLEFADAIGETSERLGLTTDEFQKFAFAAKRAGIDQDGFAQSIDRLNQSIGSAIEGNKDMQATLLSLGINAEDVKSGQVSLGEAFLRISDNLGKYNTTQEKAAVLTDLFGKAAGPKLVPLLSQGRQAVSELGAEAERMGAILDASMIKKAEEANDKLDDLAKIIQVNFTSGMLDGATEGFSNFADLAKDPAIRDGIREIGELMGQLARITLDVAAGAGLIVKNLKSVAIDYRSLESVNEGIDRLEKEEASGGWMKDLSKNTRSQDLANLRQVREKLLKDFLAQRPQSAEPGTKADSVPRMTGARDDILKNLKSVDESVKLAQKEREQIDKVVEGLIYKNQQLGRSTVEQELNNQLRAAGVELMSDEGQRIKRLVEDNYQLEKAQDRNRRQTELWQEAITELGSGFDDLRGLALRTLSEIANALIQLNAGTGQGSGLGGLLVSGLGSVFGSFASSSPTIANPNIAGTSYMLEGRASGGPVMPFTDYIVGEKGPEILRMGAQSGSVVPNNKIGGGMVIEYIDARGTSNEVVDNLMAQIRDLNGEVQRIDRGFEARAQTAVESRRSRSNSYMRG